MRTVYVSDHLFILTVSSWTSDGLSLHFLGCSLISETCDTHVTFIWAGIWINIVHGEIRRRINSESILLFCHKTTGNPTFQNTENDCVWQQNSNFARCFMCVWNIVSYFQTEYKLWVYVNRVLKKIPIHMKAKVSRQFRTLCDENLCVYTGYQLLFW